MKCLKISCIFYVVKKVCYQDTMCPKMQRPHNTDDGCPNQKIRHHLSGGAGGGGCTADDDNSGFIYLFLFVRIYGAVLCTTT